MADADEFEKTLRALSKGSDGRLSAAYESYRLESAFQPIFRRDEAGLVLDGHEALLRPTLDGAPIPVHTFLNAVDRDQAFSLERLCRMLHVRNFRSGEGDKQRLFLNVNPMAFTDVGRSGQIVGEFLLRLEGHGIQPDQIVLEIVETMHEDKAVLAQVVQQFRGIGVIIAIDDFGADYSNFDRVFDLHPDVVKFDRQWLARCRDDARAVRFLDGMVELIKELDVEVSCEGIETEGELRIALNAGFDLFQGYFLGRPSASLATQVINYPSRAAAGERRPQPVDS